MMHNALSVDVEDWFQVGAFERTIDRSDWEGLTHRVERNTDAVLDLFAQAGVTATFFTLGWVAERYPALMRRIAEAGHEVASHGYDHARVFTFTPEQFRADLRKARAILEDASGQKVSGYRAPSFSIDPRTPWAHPILAEEGYAYSSSVAPIRHDHYGWPDSPRFAWKPVAGSDLLELPVTTAKLGQRTLAAGGGGFFRLLPYGFSRWAIRQVNGQAQRPAIIYFHPWEIDPDQPRVAGAPLRSRVRHYTNLSVMARKLRRLTQDFAWTRVDALIAQEAARAA
ncbi:MULTISPECIES: XrtA system polysaccharide deacetylase [Sphingobium]|uniref:Chitooligosaccharide deacetylase n=1 Tax=Sphingobium yanoikuyae ATCC 51230 TaxID=883163 RepID=K9D1R0_SPHYA|nr:MULTISPECIES: XrtA system polysaccharide deacetylase [Sphingobium]EKU72892.1 polysaccharide deactylase, PEP-CTERM locus subfamily [Sphingobium yanoikuyae ATCC 51230]WQE08545.1 XrtA system polysaccharide deacetylase [Sphingobium yanoikuyae]SHL50879.1 polysaccharide deacetylase family protein, PEP-CTERM locus subfamily [Sphingobium sp. YR657]